MSLKFFRFPYRLKFSHQITLYKKYIKFFKKGGGEVNRKTHHRYLSRLSEFVNRFLLLPLVLLLTLICVFTHIFNSFNDFTHQQFQFVSGKMDC